MANTILAIVYGYKEKIMDLNEYQTKARKTAIYPGTGNGDLTYCTLGLNGEAGEVAEKVKKIMRDKKGKYGDEETEDIKKELGDVLWYIANLAAELGVKLNDVALTNIDKLTSRSERNKLKGSGDSR